ncbi:TIR domain-containing protein [Peterkaempfera griseoplana]|uniref:toll/interleukin-1 receptor domain-containing protein n=1 Tax=Peterkaempfera griseoplana TaxID=66896 RepID=UPI0006E38C7D|nr:toll/interleukin-1 receptor domain-containing protein [Peterkaempfera griseoplana]
MPTYAVSHAETSEAWVSRFLLDLRQELERQAPGAFTRVGDGPDGAGEDGLRGARTADVLLSLCSPAYFGDERVGREWAVAVQRRTLGRARTGVTPQTVLPLLWEPLAQRLPSVAAEADTLRADALPAAYRLDGLAQLTMQAPRLRSEYRAVVSAVAGRLVASTADRTPPPLPPEDSAADLPPAFAADDAAFTRRFRELLREAPLPFDGGPAVDVPRRAAPVGAGSAAALLREQLPDLGRRIALLGPRGSGRRRELAWLARAVLEEEPGSGPWGCEVPLELTVRPGWMPAVADLVQAVAPRLRTEEPAGWTARRLRSGRALITLAGLEALPSGGRAAVWEWLLRLLAEYPQSPCAVACDGVGLPWQRLDGDWTPVRLEPWSTEDVGAFLGLAARGAPGDAEGAGRGARALAGLLAGDPVLRDLMAWPASAAGVWTAVRAAGGEPPPGRRRLLDAAVAAVWLPGEGEAAEPQARRRQARSGDGALRAAAGRLAAAAVRDESGDVAWEAAAEAAGGGRPQGQELLEALAERSGVLWQPGPGVVSFAHDALRDCLAAPELAGLGAAGAAELLTGLPERRHAAELVLLVAAELPAEERDAFLLALIDRAGDGGALLSAAAVAAADGCGDRVADRLRKALLALAPLEPADLRLLARGGPAVRDLLPSVLVPAQPPVPGSAADRAARPADTGAPGHSPVRRLPARTAVVPRAPAPHTAHDRRELEALARLPHVAEVHCHGPIDRAAELLPRLRGLRTLVISGDPGLTALPDLAGCRTLRTLAVRGCTGLRDVSALAASDVVFAELAPGPARVDLEPLRGARWLRRLDLIHHQGAPVSVWYLGRVEVRVHS